MFKTIVVAVDGSDHAAKAAELAIDLAKRYGARLFALSVYRHYSKLESSHSMVRTREVPESPDATLSLLAREAAQWVVDKADEADFPGVEPVVRRGPAARTIIEFAKESGADAVVIGSRGLGDITGMLLGSVSHKVNSLAGCTCITVK
ncbi:MAG: universal stress protein [Tistlia sp.]|uniref:universal stress protein n=1 Tax=Tistlia sp. TaxID=3057121 RepID=UPI0034A448D7